MPTFHRRQRVIESLALSLLCLYLFGYTLPRAWRTLNTDFPNYYLTARLTREGIDPSRAYEWIWLQREKDHREIDQRIVGLVPITPFSTLAMWPIATLPPLTAKHLWLAFNLALLLPVALLVKRICGSSLLQVGILLAVSFPLHRNLLYGQHYIVLLAILTAACWAAQRRYSHLAGALVALATAVKVFPVLLALYFLRKKDWRALTAFGITGILAALASIAVFGWSLHRTYLLQVLPWTLRGECLDPYNLTSSSISTLLHRLFIYEPQWNPHPAWHAPWLLVVLHPLLQLALLGPALLWIDPKNSSRGRVALEWAALLFATLTITPLPASYHFTVLILPMAILCGYLVHTRRLALFTIAILLYLAVGYPGWNTSPADGWFALLHVPRLYALVLLTAISLSLLKRPSAIARERTLWSAGIAAALAFSILAGLRHQRRLFDDYAYRLPMPAQTFLASQPIAVGDAVHFIGLFAQGYRSATMTGVSARAADAPDQLSFAASGGSNWTETVSKQSILISNASDGSSISNAESPAITLDGKTLAFLRESDGRKQLFVREPGQPERQLTDSSASWNVEEAAFVADGSLIIAAARNSERSSLYVVSGTGHIQPMPVGEARYPAVSPDGRWLAYSGFASGNWNLYLLDLATGAHRRFTTAPCNQIQPSWEPDSKTLLYGSDCGRSLWFTAICRRRILP